MITVTVWKNSLPDIDTDLHPWLTAAALGEAWERMEDLKYGDPDAGQEEEEEDE